MHATSAPAYQALFDQAPVAMVAFGLDRRVLAVSDRWLAMTGLRREDVLGRDAFEVHPELPGEPGPDGRSARRAAVEELLRTREPRSLGVQVYRVVREDGPARSVHCAVEASPLRGPDGEVQGVVATLTEVPAPRLDEAAEPQDYRAFAAEVLARSRDLEEAYRRLRLAHEALEAKDGELRRSRATLEAFLEHAPLYVSIRDLDECYLYLNGESEAMFRHHGLDPAALIGRSQHAFLPPEQAAAMSARLRQVIATGGPVRGEHMVNLPEGFRTMEAVHFPIPDVHGGVQAVGTIGIDVTEGRDRERRLRELAEALEARNAELEARNRELERMEGALRASRAALEAFLDRAPCSAWMQDLEGRYTYLNGQAAENLAEAGLDQAQVMGRRDAALFPPAWARRYEALKGEALARRAPVEVEERLPGAEARTYRVTHFPLLDAEGRPWALAGLAVDVTRDRLRERALQDLAADLDARNRELEEKDRALRDGTAILQGFLDHLPCNAWIKAPDGRMEYLNGPAAGVFERLGFTREDILGRAAWEFYPPAWAERSREQHRALVEAGGRSVEEIALPEQWGMAYTRIIHFPIHAPDGSLRAIAGLALDLTEERRREKELRALAGDLERHNRELEAKDRELKESRAALETFLDHAPCSVWIKDSEERFLYMNRVGLKALEALGLGRSDVLGRRAQDIYPAGWSDPMRPHYERFWATGQTVDDEVTIQDAGGPRAYRFSLVPLRAADGTVKAIGGLALDVTERLVREEQLRALAESLERRNRELEAKDQELGRSRATLEAFLDRAPCLAWLKDAEGRVVYMNRAAARALAEMGIPPEAVDGRAPWEVSPGPLTARAREVQLRMAAGGGAEHAEAEIRVEGRTVVMETTHFPLRREDGTLWAVAALAVDVTEHKRREKELQALAGKLERRNRDLEDFATVASHDLHEPLRKILTFTDRLQKRAAPRLEDRERQDLDRIHQAAGRMRAFIDDLLDYSRVDTGETSFGLVDLSAVIREVLADLEARLEESRAVVEVGPLPVLEGDRTQLKQLLQNLLANALKYRRPGFPPRVRVRARELENRWVLEVEDEGIGFEPQYAERIFGIFQRLHTRSQYEGTGVGLALCRRIAERHGGSISAEGRPGEGATFRVELPR